MTCETMTGVLAGLALIGLAACGSGEAPGGSEPGTETPAASTGSSATEPAEMAVFPEDFPLPPSSIATSVSELADDESGTVIMIVGEFSSPMAQAEVENYFASTLPGQGYSIDSEMPMMLTFVGNGYENSSVSFFDLEPFQAGSNFTVTLMPVSR